MNTDGHEWRVDKHLKKIGVSCLKVVNVSFRLERLSKTTNAPFRISCTRPRFELLTSVIYNDDISNAEVVQRQMTLEEVMRRQSLGRS
jgi:hypothetical protein